MKTKIFLVLALTLTVGMLMMPHVRATPNADINNDGSVDILDVTLAGTQYKLTSSDPGYDAAIVEKADFNLNGMVDLLDVVTIIGRFTG